MKTMQVFSNKLAKKDRKATVIYINETLLVSPLPLVYLLNGQTNFFKNDTLHL